ncbi:hypothetical protein F5Y16DRAFT_396995 [Xylariaceae sp. FL0255]|nr:hypothetical protein F5Y16DRAFT_396995 [Xylariaceae sp. FL0255]
MAKREGKCTYCYKKEPPPGRLMCEDCVTRTSGYRKKYRLKKMLQTMCAKCGISPVDFNNKKFCAECRPALVGQRRTSAAKLCVQCGVNPKGRNRIKYCDSCRPNPTRPARENDAMAKDAEGDPGPPTATKSTTETDTDKGTNAKCMSIIPRSGLRSSTRIAARSAPPPTQASRSKGASQEKPTHSVKKRTPKAKRKPKTKSFAPTSVPVEELSAPEDVEMREEIEIAGNGTELLDLLATAAIDLSIRDAPFEKSPAGNAKGKSQTTSDFWSTVL